jgi:phosphatidylglycerophosphatase A
MRKNFAPRTVWTNPIHFIACGFGLGTSRFAPGTFGTLLAVVFYLFLRHLSAPWYLLTLVVAFILGVWWCDITEKDFGVPDHAAIVWDEIVGFWITMFLVPIKWNWLWVLIGFILFRVFDIWKPWPIRWVDSKMPGGLGIMVDDVIAAIYAWVILQAIIFGVLR